MTEVIDRLAAAVNAHDLDAVAGLIHEDYRSEQPAHPGRAFAGRAQMLANWEAMLAGIPDFCAEMEAYRFRRHLYYAIYAILVSTPSSYSEGVRYPSPF